MPEDQFILACKALPNLSPEHSIKLNGFLEVTIALDNTPKTLFAIHVTTSIRKYKVTFFTSTKNEFEIVKEVPLAAPAGINQTKILLSEEQ